MIETIKVKGVNVFLYSLEDWIKSEGIKRNSVGRYINTALNPLSPGDTTLNRSIHILSCQEEMDKFSRVKGWNKNRPVWERILIHEYVHYLQYKIGEWEMAKPIGFDITISDFIKRSYREDKWVIEAEARWVERRPWIIGWEPLNR